jgi:hypothetical protein
MEEGTLEPKWIGLENSRDGYVVILYDENDKVIEKHQFGQDLLDAAIRAQKLQDKLLTVTPNECYVFIRGFPNKHPNQTTLD